MTAMEYPPDGAAVLLRVSTVAPEASLTVKTPVNIPPLGSVSNARSRGVNVSLAWLNSVAGTSGGTTV